MRGSTMLALALACVVALVAVTTTGVQAADSLAICRFQNSDTITGWITLTQAVEGGVVVIGSNFTSSVAVSALYAHVHTYGDLGGEPECFIDYTYGPWTSEDADTHFTDSRTVHGFSLSGDNSIIGRSISLYESISNCATGCNSVAVASCVVGNRNYAASELYDTNAASQVLSEDPVSAYVKFVAGSSAPTLSGEAWFVPTASGLVYVKVLVSGLNAGSVHAIHVHTYGDIHLATGLSAGLHLNPAHVNHGYPPSPHRHMGDLGNFTASADGVVEVAKLFDLLSFTAASGNIIGRGLIIHTLGDDGNPANTNTSTGAAGGRLGMGVVGISARLPDAFVDPTSEGDDMFTAYTPADFVARVAVTSESDSRAASLRRVAKAVKALLAATPKSAQTPGASLDVAAQRLRAAKALLTNRAQDAADAIVASATLHCSALCQLRRAAQAAKMLLAKTNVAVDATRGSTGGAAGATSIQRQGMTGSSISTTTAPSVTVKPKGGMNVAVDAGRSTGSAGGATSIQRQGMTGSSISTTSSPTVTVKPKGGVLARVAKAARAAL